MENINDNKLINDIQIDEDINQTQEDSNAYKFKLEKFEGPLDLLLHLIKDAKIDIKDIFISSITEQFLDYINNMPEMPVEKVGDFIEMAATLLEIKSRKLLPVPIDESEEESPEQQLIKKLQRHEEYLLFQENADKFRALEDTESLYRQPNIIGDGYRYELKDLSFDAILDAFAIIMNKIDMQEKKLESKQIAKDRFTVVQKISDIKDILLTKDKIKFSELYSTDYSKSEVINTFLALLELLKTQVIKVIQTDVFEEIYIQKQDELNNN